MILSGYPMSWLEKEIILNCLISHSTQQETFSYHMVIWKRVDCTSQLAGQWLYQEADPKHFPKPNLHPPQRLWSLLGHLRLIRSTTASWIPGNYYIWVVCSENGWDSPKTAVLTAMQFFMTPPNTHTSRCFKIWTNPGYGALTHLFQPPGLSPTDHTSSKISKKILLQPTGCRQCFPKSHWLLKHEFLHNRKTYFSPSKTLLIIFPILINKNVFEL